MNIVVQANIVRDVGGHLCAPQLPTPEQFDRLVRRDEAQHAARIKNGGCGEEMYSFGGLHWVRCGSAVTAFGKTEIQRCRKCGGRF